MSLTNNSDDESDFNDITASNYRKIQDKVEKIGYVDGVTDGKDSTFQSGFDHGYEDGLHTALELHKYRAFYEHIDDNTVDSALIEEKTKFMAMQLAPMEAAVHCQYKENEDLESIGQKQTEYVNDLLNNFIDKLPIATNLLSSEKAN